MYGNLDAFQFYVLVVSCYFIKYLDILAVSFGLVQVCAGSCKFMQVLASLCKFMQVCASSHKFVQVLPSLCKFLQVRPAGFGLLKFMQIYSSSYLAPMLSTSAGYDGALMVFPQLVYAVANTQKMMNHLTIKSIT